MCNIYTRTCQYSNVGEINKNPQSILLVLFGHNKSTRVFVYVYAEHSLYVVWLLESTSGAIWAPEKYRWIKNLLLLVLLETSFICLKYFKTTMEWYKKNTFPFLYFLNTHIHKL